MKQESVGLAALVGLLAAFVSVAFGPFPLPANPAATLDLASKSNGLGSALHPWHVRATYQIFNSGGAKQTSGTFEEFWISERQYKSHYESSTFSQTDFAANGGILRSGDQNWPEYFAQKVRSDLIRPVADASNPRDFQFGEKGRSIGKLKLDCITLTPAAAYPTISVYCLEPDRPVLRVAISSVIQDETIFNDVFEFQDHFVARNVSVMQGRRPRLTYHVEEIGNLDAVDDHNFVPPADAVRVPLEKITLSQETLNRRCIKQVPPVYPASAKASHTQGKVLMRVTVGKNGQVESAQALEGPAELQRAALEAIRKWEFQPFLVLGEPVEIDGTIQITFTLG